MIIVIRDIRHSDLYKMAADMNIKIMRFTDVEKTGAARVSDTCPAAPHDVALICYSPMMATDQRPKVVKN